MTVLTRILLIFFGVIIFLHISFRIFRKLCHFPAPAFMGPLFDSKLRGIIQPYDKFIERSSIKKGMKVLEIGCGSGALTTVVAKTVRESGKVYALDIQSKMLEQLSRKLARPEYRDIKNIELIKSSAYELPFDDNSLDLVYLVTVLPEIPDRQKALRQIQRVLKPGGILAVTELLLDPDYPLKSTTIKIGKKAGFVLDTVQGNIFNYTVRFRKP
jgi:ubiquinone/menaquinone biosynthesis C-methylase UbiE